MAGQIKFCDDAGNSLGEHQPDMGRAYRDAANARVGADRMALGLPCIPDRVAGDMQAVSERDKVLRAIISHCGHPDAGEGCRLAIAAAKSALRGEPK